MSETSSSSIVRLGFIHIPESMGTSLGNALAYSLNARYLPIHLIASDQTMANEAFSIRVPSHQHSLTRDVLLSYPLIAGHLSVGQIQETSRTHIVTVITEPRQRLIKLFAHHGAPGLCFSDWLAERVELQSDLIDCLGNGSPKPHAAHWKKLHARSHRRIRHAIWSYNPEYVENIVSPIDIIFLHQIRSLCLTACTTNPYFRDIRLLNTPTVVTHFIKLTGVTSRLNLKFWRVTTNDYKFIDHMSSTAQIDPQFETWDDARTYRFLFETAGTS